MNLAQVQCRRGTKRFPCPHPLIASLEGEGEVNLEWGVALIANHCEMVGTRGFEPPTPRTPSVCATRLRYVPTPGANLAPAIQNCQDVPELELHLIELFGRRAGRLGLGFRGAGRLLERNGRVVLFGGKQLACTRDGESTFVE